MRKMRDCKHATNLRSLKRRCGLARGGGGSSMVSTQQGLNIRAVELNLVPADPTLISAPSIHAMALTIG